MKTYLGVEVWLRAFLTSALGRDEWLIECDNGDNGVRVAVFGNCLVLVTLIPPRKVSKLSLHYVISVFHFYVLKEKLKGLW
jgi:hypothetical protein